MTRKINKSKKTSIRIRPDILEIAQDMNRAYGYSYSDIFEMGVLLIDNNNESDSLIMDQIYSTMLEKFEQLDNNIQKKHELLKEVIQKNFDKMNTHIDKEFENIESNILKEIGELESKKNIIKEKGNDKIILNSKKQVDDVVDSIVDMIVLREDNMRKPKHTRKLFEPVGKEYYELKASTSGVPMNIILDELSRRGYSVEYLKSLDMNPERKWLGTVEMSKASMS